jgi:hypothetical protein
LYANSALRGNVDWQFALFGMRGNAALLRGRLALKAHNPSFTRNWSPTSQ